MEDAWNEVCMREYAMRMSRGDVPRVAITYVCMDGQRVEVVRGGATGHTAW
jgi:hypothetical protein